jgi:hypothetical protein
MKFNWNSKMASAVQTHLEALLRCEQTIFDEERSVAHRTNALPVYSDLSGTLTISPEGTVLYYNSESGEIEPITDDTWTIVAAVSAAEKYPDLRALLPEKPPTAKTCSLCSGTGRQLKMKALCGKCFGLGWVLS